MKPITKFLFCLTLLFSPFYLKSTHIIGGTTSYQLIEVTDESATLQLSFYLYKDSQSPAQLDENISIGLFGYKNEEYSFIAKQDVMLSFSSPVIFDDIEGCPNSQFSYLEGIYSFEIVIPINDFDHYTFAYQRCCRNEVINNILFPTDTGIAITLDIYPKALEIQNVIPPLNNMFPIQAEPGTNNSFDISLEDPFEKEYFLSVPKASGGILGSGEPGDPNGCQGIIPDPQNCPPEYADIQYIDPENPYGADANVVLDKDDGILDINIPATSIVLFGVTLDRYADNELICRSRQQFVLNNISCLPTKVKNTAIPELLVWPIPANEYIKTNIPLKQVNIFSVTGDSQSIRQNDKFSNEFDISDLSPGLYFLRGLTLYDKWVVKRIIKS